MTSLRSLTVVVVLLALLTAGLGAADATVAVDDNHPVASEETIAEYEATGVASGELPQFDASLTVADDHEDASLDGPYLDTNTQYVRIDYNEEIPRTVRIYLPAELVSPRVKSGLEAENADVSADFAPVESAQYVAMTVRFDEPTTATFALSAEAGIVWEARETGRDAVNNTTGITLPTLGSNADWRFVESLNQSQPVALEGQPDTLTVQYDAQDGPGREWLSVSECDDPTEQAVCYYRQGNDTIIMTTQSDPPTVRYQQSNDVLADFKSSVRDLGRVPSKIADSLGGILGGAQDAA